MPRFEDLAAEGQALVEVGGEVVGVDVATQAELNGHATDTTDVHGIADTSLLETTAGAQAKADAAEAAANTYTDNSTSSPLPPIGTTVNLATGVFSNVLMLNNRLYLAGLIELATARTLSKVSTEINVAGNGSAVLRFGVVTIPESGVAEGAALTSLGSVAATTAALVTLSGLSTVLPAGLHAFYVATNGDAGTAPTMRSANPHIPSGFPLPSASAVLGRTFVSVNTVTGALPATLPVAAASGSSTAPILALEFSA